MHGVIISIRSADEFQNFGLPDCFGGFAL